MLVNNKFIQNFVWLEYPWDTIQRDRSGKVVGRIQFGWDKDGFRLRISFSSLFKRNMERTLEWIFQKFDCFESIEKESILGGESGDGDKKVIERKKMIKTCICVCFSKEINFFCVFLKDVDESNGALENLKLRFIVTNDTNCWIHWD